MFIITDLIDIPCVYIFKISSQIFLNIVPSFWRLKLWCVTKIISTYRVCTMSILWIRKKGILKLKKRDKKGEKGKEKKREKGRNQDCKRAVYPRYSFRHFSQMQPRRALSRPFILAVHFAPSPDNVLFSRDVYFPAGWDSSSIRAKMFGKSERERDGGKKGGKRDTTWNEAEGLISLNNDDVRAAVTRTKLHGRFPATHDRNNIVNRRVWNRARTRIPTKKGIINTCSISSQRGRKRRDHW